MYCPGRATQPGARLAIELALRLNSKMNQQFFGGFDPLKNLSGKPAMRGVKSCPTTPAHLEIAT